MHKKLYSLVISGIIVANTACSTGQVYANIIDIEKSMNELKDSDNPQVKELYFKLKGELRLLEGVLQYTEFGAKSMLTVYNY